MVSNTKEIALEQAIQKHLTGFTSEELAGQPQPEDAAKYRIGSPLDWFGIVPIPILFTGGDDETWRSIAGYTHIFAGYALIAMIVGHIGAALWHECIHRDRLIRDRML